MALRAVMYELSMLALHLQLENLGICDVDTHMRLPIAHNITTAVGMVLAYDPEGSWALSANVSCES